LGHDTGSSQSKDWLSTNSAVCHVYPRGVDNLLSVDLLEDTIPTRDSKILINRLTGQNFPERTSW
jgi:hypothetical protein